MLSEGDVFEIQIPLKKSDFTSEKSDFTFQKISLDILMSRCREKSYNVTVVENIKKLYERIETDQAFGISDIKEILECAKSTAAGLMKRLRSMDVVIPVKGKGRGKYRFRYESEME